MLSVCPDRLTFELGFSFMNATSRSRICAASGLIALLSKSNKTSSKMIVLSTFGAGGGGGGGGGGGSGFGGGGGGGGGGRGVVVPLTTVQKEPEIPTKLKVSKSTDATCLIWPAFLAALMLASPQATRPKTL